ncbi:hypothetical protein Ddye_015475 [Dipteronia dyeriana]|uniref:Uncharacterized protein n=1 Tax=Dipteronia dyeriana TaxID=168575 RepID=A0AAD9WYJ0_9ROSI|nr:hypothetical protein Ddye_015475 [Dipteronia dyeriana]
MSSWIYSILVKLFSLIFNCFGLCSRDVKTGLPELMVNFETSSDKPELLEPLIEKISSIPEVVCMRNFHFHLCLNITFVFSLFSLGLEFEWFKSPSLGFDKLDLLDLNQAYYDQVLVIKMHDRARFLEFRLNQPMLVNLFLEKIIWKWTSFVLLCG